MSDAPSSLPLGAVPARSPACEDLISRVADRLDARIEEISRRINERINAEIGFDPDDEELQEQFFVSTRANIALITVMARSWTDASTVPPPHDTLVWVRGLVARGVPIDLLLRAYRIGQSGYEAAWIHELASSDAEHDVVIEAIAAVSAFISTWVDAIATPLAEAHEEERARRTGGSSAVRLETIEQILGGQPTDLPVASARLRYALDRRHVALTGWAPAERVDTTEGSLDDRLDDLARLVAAPGDRPLVARLGPQLAAAWIAADVPSDDVLDRVRERARELDLRVAVGTGGVGLDGFRRSHERAMRARRVARLLRPASALTRYDDVAVLDLLTRDPAAAREFALMTLGPLAEDDDGARRLVATLRVFLDEGQNYARAARRLGVHENTVAYRVRRALELTGATDPDAHALRTAIALAPLLGDGHDDA